MATNTAPTHVVVTFRDDPSDVLAWWPLPAFGGEESYEDGDAWKRATQFAALGDNDVKYARHVDGEWVV